MLPKIYRVLRYKDEEAKPFAVQLVNAAIEIKNNKLVVRTWIMEYESMRPVYRLYEEGNVYASRQEAEREAGIDKSLPMNGIDVDGMPSTVWAFHEHHEHDEGEIVKVDVKYQITRFGKIIAYLRDTYGYGNILYGHTKDKLLAKINKQYVVNEAELPTLRNTLNVLSSKYKTLNE